MPPSTPLASRSQSPIRCRPMSKAFSASRRLTATDVSAVERMDRARYLRKTHPRQIHRRRAMTSLEKGITANGTGYGGKTWNILGQVYFPKAVTESTFAFETNSDPGQSV